MTVEFTKDETGMIVETIREIPDSPGISWFHNDIVSTLGYADFLPECFFKFQHLDRLRFEVK